MKAALKRSLLGGAHLLGINRVLRSASRKRLLVLCYHGVISESRPDDELRYSTTVSIKEFRAQLRILRRQFAPVAVDDVLAWLQGRAELPRSPVLLTFDDGFRNNLTYAAPELVRHSVPALVNVATQYIGTSELLWPQELVERILRWSGDKLPSTKGPDIVLPTGELARRGVAAQVRRACKVLPDPQRRRYLDRLREQPFGRSHAWDDDLYAFLSWEEVRKLDAMGIEIGSHTATHPILSRLDGPGVERELTASKTAIERALAKPCRAIAYPNGTEVDYNQGVLESAARAGYELGFTLKRSLNRASAWALALDRVDIAGHAPLDVFRARVSGLFSLLERHR